MASYSITITAQGSSNYIFNGSHKGGTLSNSADPTLSFDQNDTVTFTFNQGGSHPFIIEKSGETSFGSYSSGSQTWTASASGTWA